MFYVSKKIARTAIISLLLVIGISFFVFAEYDRDRVVQVMRNNVALMGAIGDAAKSENWELAAQKLFELAEGMIDVRQFDPPRGSKEDWDDTMTQFVSAAYRGIGACGARDSDGLQEAIGQLLQLNRQGHGAHKTR